MPTKCAHCGGSIYQDTDEAKCLQCGRPAVPVEPLPLVTEHRERVINQAAPTASEAMALEALDEAMTSSQLAERIGVKTKMAGQWLRQLRDKGLITGARDESRSGSVFIWERVSS